MPPGAVRQSRPNGDHKVIGPDAVTIPKFLTAKLARDLSRNLQQPQTTAANIQEQNTSKDEDENCSVECKIYGCKAPAFRTNGRNNVKCPWSCCIHLLCSAWLTNITLSALARAWSISAPLSSQDETAGLPVVLPAVVQFVKKLTRVQGAAFKCFLLAHSVKGNPFTTPLVLRLVAGKRAVEIPHQTNIRIPMWQLEKERSPKTREANNILRHLTINCTDGIPCSVILPRQNQPQPRICSDGKCILAILCWQCLV